MTKHTACVVILKEMVITIKVMDPPFSSFQYDCMGCIWDLPLSQLNLTAGSLPCALFYGWISSPPHPDPRHYCDRYRTSPSIIRHATEHFEHKNWWERFYKLVNHVEKWGLYNVLNGNCLGLFLYLTPSISPVCSTILQSACGFNCEIQCCDVLIEWILSL